MKTHRTPFSRHGIVAAAALAVIAFLSISAASQEPQKPPKTPNAMRPPGLPDLPPRTPPPNDPDRRILSPEERQEKSRALLPAQLEKVEKQKSKGLPKLEPLQQSPKAIEGHPKIDPDKLKLGPKPTIQPPTPAEGEQPPAVLQRLLETHRAWKQPPSVIEINGTLTRPDNKTGEPVRITANDKEETAIEYGLLRDKKRIRTPIKDDLYDGQRLVPGSAPPGFSQLDITGIYLVAQAMAVTPNPLEAALRSLNGRTGPPKPAPAWAKPAEAVVLKGANAQKVTVYRGRIEVHPNASRVEDMFDLYINQEGLLAGIGRAFYTKTAGKTGQPYSSAQPYTQGYLFYDYRDVNGVALPFRIERYYNGKLVETVTVSEYRFDVATDPILFQIHASRKAAK